MPTPCIQVISRKQHTISRKNISENAIKVLYRLNKAGYTAYLVGGGVRDLLLGIKPKDFDITTDATPDQVRKLFHNCRLIGRRFRLAHVIFSQEIIEVATFRGHHTNIISTDHAVFQYDQNNMLLRDNIFGSIEEDFQRRDFTINSLYYNIEDFTVHDYIGGLQDLKIGLIRVIGNPETRYYEDPVRMLRAVRFAARLNMHISSETSEPFPRLAMLIKNVSSARLFEEVLKLLQSGYGFKTYILLRKYNLFQSLFPSISRYLTNNGNSHTERIILKSLKKIDSCIHKRIYVNPAFLFATIFWYPLLQNVQNIVQINSFACWYDAFMLSVNNILYEACRILAIPKYITVPIRDIWKLQIHMFRHRYSTKRALKLIEHPKFYMAYNLLVLRADIEKDYELQSLVRWWRDSSHGILKKKESLPFCHHKKINKKCMLFLRRGTFI